MFKTKVDEAAYAGNIGIMELIKFKQKATTEQKKKFDDLLQKKKSKEVWNLVQDVTGVNPPMGGDLRLSGNNSHLIVKDQANTTANTIILRSNNFRSISPR